MVVALATSRRQDKPAPRFASGDLLVGGSSLREGDDAVDLGCLECALLEHGRQRLEQRPRGDCIAVARVHAEQTALVVVEVENVIVTVVETVWVEIEVLVVETVKVDVDVIVAGSVSVEVTVVGTVAV